MSFEEFNKMFDSIRKVDENEKEYATMADLQKVFGISDDEMEVSIEKARRQMITMGYDKLIETI